MKQCGLTLVEMITVMAIMSSLLTMGSLSFGRMSQKYAIEGQTRAIYTELMNLRLKAMYKKKVHTATLTSRLFTTYSSLDKDNKPVGLISSKNLDWIIVPNAKVATIRFDTHGLTSNLGSVCTEPSDNPAALDSIIISMTRINMGKLKSGRECKKEIVTDDIDIR